MNNDKEKPSIHISGQVQGAIVNIGGQTDIRGNVTISIHNMQQSIARLPEDDHKAELSRLVERLQTALQQLPGAYQQEGQDLARRADELLSEVAQTQPDSESVAFKSNKLKQMAEKIKGAMPVVLEIATQIITQVAQLHHL
jgi:Cu/Ag efflux pump CusA